MVFLVNKNYQFYKLRNIKPYYEELLNCSETLDHTFTHILLLTLPFESSSYEDP